jgi:hypothetical protein
MIQLIIVLLASTTLFAQTIDDVVIPRKTEIFITLGRTVSTKTATAGDKFFGQIAVPVTINDRIVIPAGSHIIGHVDKTKKPRRVKGEGEIALRFDTVILPDGTTRQIAAALASAEGYEATAGEEGVIVAESDQGEEAAAGAVKGAVTGAGIGGIAGRSWKGAGIGSIAGAATGAVIGVMKKNNEVVLPRGTSLTVQLDQDVRFIKPEPLTSRGVQLESEPAP